MSEEQIESIQKYLPNSPAGGVLNFGFDQCLADCQKSKPAPRPATTTRATITRPTKPVVYESKVYEARQYKSAKSESGLGLGLGVNIGIGRKSYKTQFDNESQQQNQFSAKTQL